MLKNLASNEYSVKESFDFAKEILEQNSECFMASLDITSLLSNIPLEETINICFIFDKKFYKELDGVAMGFPFR